LIENYQQQIDKIKLIIINKYKSFEFKGELKKLGEIFDISIGRTPPTKERNWFSNGSNSFKWLSIKDMSTNGDFILSTSQYLTHEAVKKFNIPIVNTGDILLSFKLTLGRVGISLTKMVTNEAIACFKVTDDLRTYLYCFLSCYNFYSEMDNTSSIGKAFNSSLLKEIIFLNPSKCSLSKFNEVVIPYIEKLKLLRLKEAKLKEIKSKLLAKYF
jgi:type I restriction enzyme, S subunit